MKLLKNEELLKLNNKILNAYKDKDIVLGNGNVDSPIILIGEAPGAKEVEQRKPFVGQAGKYLNEFLTTLEIKREKVYITNIVKYRPTKESAKTGKLINRPPTEKEIEKFVDFLFAEICIIDPEVLVTLGNTPLKGIFQNDVKIGDVHGEMLQAEIDRKPYKVFPLYHPAAILYKRDLKDTYLKDLRILKGILSEMGVNI